MASMEALFTTLKTLRLQGSIFSRAQLQAPWGVHTLGSERAIFHVVTQGQAWLRPKGQAPIPLQTGDLAVMMQGQEHIISDAQAGPARHITRFQAPVGDDGLPCLSNNADGEQTALLCGTLTFDPGAAPFIARHLPGVLHAASGSTAPWLDTSLRMLAEDVGGQTQGSAGQAIAGRLAEVLFIQVLRRMAAQDSPPPWLQALSDPQIGRALALLHQSPQNAWTAQTLAARAGMSRSSFFQRFQALLGETPTAYLTRWRMTVACGAMQDPGAGLFEVAQAVGYASEAAFSRAFKREMGQPPSQWRAALG